MAIPLCIVSYLLICGFVFINSVMEAKPGSISASEIALMLAVAFAWPVVALALPVLAVNDRLGNA